MTEETESAAKDPQASASSSHSTSWKKLGKDTALYGAGIALSRMVGIIMLPIYTRFLTPADYGILQLLEITVEIVAILMVAGITTGMTRFYFKAKSIEHRHSVVFTAFTLETSLSLVGTILLFLAAPIVWRHGLGGSGTIALVQIAAANFTLNTLSYVPLLFLQVQQRPVAYIAATSGRLVLQLSLNILFVVGLEWGVAGILWSTLISGLVVGTVMVTWLVRTTGVRINRGDLRDLYRFGWPYQVAWAGSFVLTFGDRLFLQKYHGLAVVGLYGLAYQFGFILIQLGATPFLTAWNPHRFQLVDHPKADRDARYNRGFLMLNLLLITLATCIALFVRPLLTVMSDPAFHRAALAVPFILAAYVCHAWTDVVKFGIDVSEQTRYYGIANWLSVGLIMILYLWLIPRYGAQGAALATFIAFAFRVAVMYLFSQRLWHIDYQWTRPFIHVSGSVAATGTVMLLSGPGLIAEVLWGTAGLALYGTIVWFLVLRASDRELVWRALRSPRKAVAWLASEA